MMYWKLIDFFGKKNIDREFINYLSHYLGLFGNKFHIDTNKRIALFLGQVKAEIAIQRNGKIRMRENLNYSVTALMKIFSFYRKNPHLAQKHGRTSTHKADQKSIANYAYQGRNGNIHKNDGWEYRGVGVLQVTGRKNIHLSLEEVKKITGINITIGIHAIEDLLDTYTMGILISMAYWSINKLYLLENSRDITNRINRGLDETSKAKRDIYTKEALGLFE